MKHAFMIIAHNEFGILQRLISALDDERIDFFVHIDKKAEELPELHTEKAGLFFTKNRIDVRWGHVSQIKCELSLFKETLTAGSYAFYHLISGVHYPLKSTNEILGYYNQRLGSVIFDRFGKDVPWQEDIKIRRYNFFIMRFAYGSTRCKALYQYLWRISNELQKYLGIRRHASLDLYKAANWVSLPEDVLQYIVSKENELVNKYQMTFCGDEFFIPTELANSHYQSRLFTESKLLFQIFGEASPRVLDINDFQAISESGCLWGRKFSEDKPDILDLIDEKCR